LPRRKSLDEENLDESTKIRETTTKKKIIIMTDTVSLKMNSYFNNKDEE